MYLEERIEELDDKVEAVDDKVEDVKYVAEFFFLGKMVRNKKTGERARSSASATGS